MITFNNVLIPTSKDYNNLAEFAKMVETLRALQKNYRVTRETKIKYAIEKLEKAIDFHLTELKGKEVIK
jgi:cellulose biosynthesis protein BcsQ